MIRFEPNLRILSKYFDIKIIFELCQHNYFNPITNVWDFIPFDSDSLALLNSHEFDGYIKIVYAPKGIRLNVDFNDYDTDAPTLFFINSNQYVKFFDLGKSDGYFMYYNVCTWWGAYAWRKSSLLF
ncbi:hypothetical protein [Galbibacter pacificus]|uniref:Uncharacterized protein n=1 Tax=Galbibacter pacificus TaxID=2996052 RepID=A0ABT6FN67_9FLAO|nr:hypothetical protein [Galbibacter pacificus]MDG3581139.1 hypothetical protein [Galbibacter pacificus]MDG3584617.1 hypothetical protein [Galbibacter pacificus]